MPLPVNRPNADRLERRLLVPIINNFWGNKNNIKIELGALEYLILMGIFKLNKYSMSNAAKS